MGLGCLGQGSSTWDPWPPETQMLCPRCPDAQTSGGPRPQFLSQMGIDHQGDRRQRLDDEEATLILQGMGYTPQGPTNRACKDSVTEVSLGILRGCGLGNSTPEQSGVRGLRHSTSGLEDPDTPNIGVQDPDIHTNGYRTQTLQLLGYWTQTLQLLGYRTQILH